MSWHDYVLNLMSDKNCQDAAIVGYKGTPGVWAAHPGGCLSKITPAEIKNITSDDRSGLFVSGVTLGGMRCSVIRDQFGDPDVCVMDLKTKNPDGPSYAVVIAKALQVVVILVGIEGVHCGALYPTAHEMAKYLKSLSF
ncbi:profilin-2 isoform X2 [Pelobates cultripes]|uniref:Profilin n=1 Tax=Pelobates cultripes TaxID=61616 RepID=A0AAD1RIL2_PELCU|nr:profilin-2 isoform X2 [Pelobates cultripes]